MLDFVKQDNCFHENDMLIKRRIFFLSSRLGKEEVLPMKLIGSNAFDDWWKKKKKKKKLDEKKSEGVFSSMNLIILFDVE